MQCRAHSRHPHPAAHTRAAGRLTHASASVANEAVQDVQPKVYQPSQGAGPAVLATIPADEAEGCADAALRAGSAGANILVLQEGNNGAHELYSACISTLQQLSHLASQQGNRRKSRPTVLIADRADVASAVGADGVLLEAGGAPAAAAREAMGHKRFVLASRVHSVGDAVQAEADGASIIVAPLSATHSVRAAISSSGTSVIVAEPSDQRQLSVAASSDIQTHADGFEISPPGWRRRGGPERAVALLQHEFCNGPDTSYTSDARSPDHIRSNGSVCNAGPSTNNGMNSSDGLSQLREELAAILEQIQELVSAAGSVEEVNDVGKVSAAREQLEQPFTAVVAGEFNSGKSSVLNSLLGDHHLAEGCLPTTEGVTALSFATEATETVRNDGLIHRSLPADILRRVQLVDTPGTNAVLREQQSLAEEFVPRADLVLCVLSADRPLTASEEEFLRYLSKYGKRVAIAINKIDVLSSEKEVDQVCAFVQWHCERALGYKPAEIVPVSAKQRHEQAAGMEELEVALFQRLLSSESERLKVLSPLGIARSALNDAHSVLERQAEKLNNEAEEAHRMSQRADRLGSEVQRRSQLTRKHLRQNIDTARDQAEAIVSSNFTVDQMGELMKEHLHLRHFEGQSKVSSSTEEASSTAIGRQYMKEVACKSASAALATLDAHGQWLAQEASTVLESAADVIRDRGFSCDTNQQSESLRNKQSSALSHVEGFSHEAAANLLANEAQEMASASIVATGGSLSVGLLVAAAAPSLLEDLSALSIAAGAAYASLHAIVASKRSGAKRKIRRVSESLKATVEELIESDETSAVEECAEALRLLAEPWLLETHRLSSSAQAHLKRSSELAYKLTSLKDKLDQVVPPSAPSSLGS